MRRFRRSIERVVVIRSSDRAIPAARWVVHVDGQGVRFRRFGSANGERRLSWRSVIGYGLVHLQAGKE